MVCQTPDLGLRLGVDFTFAPLHISQATFAHLRGNPNPHPNCCQTSDPGEGLAVDFSFVWDYNNNKNPHLNFLLLSNKGQGVG